MIMIAMVGYANLTLLLLCSYFRISACGDLPSCEWQVRVNSPIFLWVLIIYVHINAAVLHIHIQRALHIDSAGLGFSANNRYH